MQKLRLVLFRYTFFGSCSMDGHAAGMTARLEWRTRFPLSRRTGRTNPTNRRTGCTNPTNRRTGRINPTNRRTRRVGRTNQRPGGYWDPTIDHLPEDPPQAIAGWTSDQQVVVPTSRWCKQPCLVCPGINWLRDQWSYCDQWPSRLP